MIFFLLLSLSQSWASTHCDIHRDKLGIPHIKSKDELSIYACLGYVHATDRLWQMDHLRRIVQGRRAEVYGFSAIKDDFRFRLLGLSEHADRLFKELSPHAKKKLAAYTEGVNKGAQVAITRGVYEFKELGVHFEPWKEEDSVGIFLLQSLDQTRKTFETEFLEKSRLQKNGVRAESLSAQDGLPWSTTILKEGEYPTGVTPLQATESLPSEHELSKAFPFFNTLNNPLESGSNNWVIAPSRSSTGKAWLANDPHLSLQTPSLWHWSHLESETFDAIGVTVPGLPLLSSGTNRYVSWGLTNSYMDVGDVAYIPEKELINLKQERPLIWIRLGFLKLPFFFKSFQRTENGYPILPLDAPKDHLLVLKWVGFHLKGQELEEIFNLLPTRSAAEMDKKLARVGLSSWNFVYADTSGKIGYRAIGKFPARASEPPFGITENNYDSFKSWNYLNWSQAPAVFNPKRGFIATGNNRQWPLGSSYPIGRAQTPSFRAFRMEELLKSSKQSRASQEKIQCDVQAVDARFIVPELLEVVSAEKWNAHELAAIALLKAWDFQTGFDCRACGIYRKWAYEVTLETEWTDSAIYRLLKAKDADFIKITTQKFRQAVKELHDLDPLFPKWQFLHLNHFRHSSKITSLDPLNPIANPGDQNSVNPGSMNLVSGVPEHADGASMRTLIEMKSPPEINAAFPAKNSDLGKEDLTTNNSPWLNWRDCKYEKLEFPLNWSTVKKGDSIGVDI